MNKEKTNPTEKVAKGGSSVDMLSDTSKRPFAKDANASQCKSGDPSEIGEKTIKEQLEDCIPEEECNIHLRDTHWIPDIEELINFREQLTRKECETEHNRLKEINIGLNNENLLILKRMKDERKKIFEEIDIKILMEELKRLEDFWLMKTRRHPSQLPVGGGRLEFGYSYPNLSKLIEIVETLKKELLK